MQSRLSFIVFVSFKSRVFGFEDSLKPHYQQTLPGQSDIMILSDINKLTSVEKKIVREQIF